MMKGRRHIYACVTKAEHATVTKLARRDGLSMSNFVRRAINAMLLEQGDDVVFLREPDTQRGRPVEMQQAKSIGR